MLTPTPDIFYTGYQPLFAVRLLHRYFLNAGPTEFDQAPTAPAVLAAHRAYEVRRWLRIVPSPATHELLRQHRLLFQLTAEGFQVLMAVVKRPDPNSPTKKLRLEPEVALPAAADFDFLAYPADPLLPLYTAGALSYYLDPKDDPAGNPRSATVGQVLALSNQGPGLPAKGAGDDPGENLVAGIDNPPLAAGAPAAFCHLHVAHRATGGKNLVGPLGLPQDRAFRYVLPNRHTLWQYKGPRTEPHNKDPFGPYPLVHHGRIDLAAELPFAAPNPTAATTEARPEGYVSVIY